MPPIGNARASSVEGLVGYEGPFVPESGVGRWTFDNADTDGSTALDSWNDNHGEISGATTGVGGANQTYDTDEAYEFDGSSDYVEVGNIPVSLDTYTICAWVNLDSTGGLSQSIASSDSGVTDRHWQLRERNGSFEFIQDIDGSSATMSYSASTSWTFVCGVQDASTAHLYINGSEQDSVNESSSAREPFLQMGYRYDTDYLDGVIDDVRLYSRALTATEISNLYNTGTIEG